MFVLIIDNLSRSCLDSLGRLSSERWFLSLLITVHLALRIEQTKPTIETNGSEHVADTLSEKSDPGQRVHADVDVLQVTKKRPHLEINFIGTYHATADS